VIVVCGEALIDMVTGGDGTRRPTPGGGPFNTARALARLEVPTAFLGRFSTDEFGRMLADQLAADGASLALASFGPEPTTIAVANIGKEGLAEYEFFIEATSAPNLTPDMIPRELPADVKALHLGTLGLVLQPMVSTLVELVRRERGSRLIMLDPNIRPVLATDPGYRPRLESLIAQSTIVKASAEDLAWLYPGVDYEAAAERVLKLFHLRVHLVQPQEPQRSPQPPDGDAHVMDRLCPRKAPLVPLHFGDARRQDGACLGHGRRTDTINAPRPRRGDVPRRASGKASRAHEERAAEA